MADANPPTTPSTPSVSPQAPALERGRAHPAHNPPEAPSLSRRAPPTSAPAVSVNSRQPSMHERLQAKGFLEPATPAADEKVVVSVVDTKGQHYRLSHALTTSHVASPRRLKASHLPRKDDHLMLGGIAFLVKSRIFSYTSTLEPHVTLIVEPLT